MRTAARTVITALAVALLAACGAGRAAPGGTPVDTAADTGVGTHTSSATGTAAATATAVPTRTPTSTPSGRVADLTSARAAWAAAGVRDYDLVVGRSCFCVETGVLHVTVRGGAVVRTVVETPPGQTSRPPVSPRQLPGSVEALFHEIAARQADSASVTVTYDQAIGVPLRIDVDRIKNAVDDEVAYLVSLRRAGRATNQVTATGTAPPTAG